MRTWSLGKKIALAVGLLVLPFAAWYGFWGYKIYSAAKKEGFLDAPAERTYSGNSMENLKAIHTALMLYQDSEGMLPQADGWMDAAWKRLQTADMKDDEARKKLKADGVTAEDEFGFAYNDLLSGKHTLDFPDPAKVPMIFDSSDLAWDAHGKPELLAPKPERNGGNKTITLEGNVVDLAPLIGPKAKS